MHLTSLKIILGARAEPNYQLFQSGWMSRTKWMSLLFLSLRNGKFQRTGSSFFPTTFVFSRDHVTTMDNSTLIIVQLSLSHLIQGINGLSYVKFRPVFAALICIS